MYRREDIELRAGDRIRWTRNDDGLGLVNSRTAEVAAVAGGKVTFRLEDGRMLDLALGDPQLRHIDRAWAPTVHVFQGRTVDTVIAAMEANHPNLTNLKTLYVEISRARDRAELVTDNKAALRETLEAVTGERIAALEAVEPERGPRRRRRRIAAAGTEFRAGHGGRADIEERRSRPRALAALLRGHRRPPDPGHAGLIPMARTPRLPATPLAVSTAGRGASSEALAFCGG